MLVLLLLKLGASVQMNNTRFVDDYGRTLIFHGFNVVVKQDPYIPITDHFDPEMSLNSQDISNLKEWGINFIRLGVMWEAVERKPGWYNMTYLNEINELINSLGKQGIYTLIDAHEDVFARSICGEGVPDFYAQYLDDSCGVLGTYLEKAGLCTPFSSYNMTRDSKGNPVLEDCLKNEFQQYFFTPQGQSAFERLYKNTYGLQDRFAEYWNMMSKYFKDNKFVIGYDILNEPLVANVFKEPWLLLPGFFDRTVLTPLYKRMHYEIRKNDESKILFFEPTQLDVWPLLGGLVLSTGFIDTPGGPSFNDKQILNDHTYCCEAGIECVDGEPPLSQSAACRRFHFNRVKTRVSDASKLGIGFIMTEFGACYNTDACAAEITNVADACEEYFISWGYWMFKRFGDFTTSGIHSEGMYDTDGALQVTKLKAIARTYIQAYQGTPLSSSLSNWDYKAVFNVDPHVKAPTVLYLNKQYGYPNGHEMRISNSAGLVGEVTEDGNFISIYFKDAVSSQTTIEVYPK